jgi:(p)ppGpp synthase/HD superfamily hydrolase
MTIKKLKKKLKSSHKGREKYIKTITDVLLDELEEYNIAPKVYGRPKSHASNSSKSTSVIVLIYFSRPL